MEAICDRVIIINKGAVVADDKISLLQSGNKKKHIILVRFKEPVQSGMLENINLVERVERLEPVAFRLHTADAEVVSRQLLQLAVEHNLDIISLQSESQSLEDVFRALTSL